MVVVDASALIELLLDRGSAPALAKRLLLSGDTLRAPYLIDIEVLHVLRRFVLAREVSAERANQAIQDYRDLRIERYPHDPLVNRIWELRGNFTAYDAVYVALAESLKAPLVTMDMRLARACPSGLRVETFP